MKRYLILAIAAVVMAACGENVEEKAEALLAEARVAVSEGRYDDGRALIDSLRRAYPTAVEGRRSAMKLENDLELADAKRTLAIVDSTLAIEARALEALKAEFVLEKDAKYQAVGYYVSPDQVAAKMHRTGLRALVNEEGLMVLVSIVHGEALQHKWITVTDGNGGSAKTPQCFSFLTHKVVGYEEEASYKLGEDGGVIDFINNSAGTLEVTYNGTSRSLNRQMSKADKAAVRHCYALAKKFDTVRILREEQEKYALKVRFFEKKISLQ